MSSPTAAPDQALDSLVARVADEFRARQDQGEKPDVEGYAVRYPEAAGLLRRVLGALKLIEESLPGSLDRCFASAPRSPAPGAPPLPRGRGSDGTSAAVAALSTQRGPRDLAAFRQIAQWGIQAALALEHAHGQGIVHRDVKPANLMIDGEGALWITDFGLARTAADAGLTLTGDVLGTLRYMSPEQALAKHGLVDHRTDIYSLGVTIYELLTLEPAFSGNDREELLRQITAEEPPAPRRINNAIHADLETIALKAMEKNPGDRYTTAQELADDLRHFREDRPIRARRPTWGQRLSKWARRHQTFVRTASVCLVVGMVGLAIATFLIDRSRREADRHREAAEQQRDEADRQRRLSDANLGLAFQTLDEMYVKIAEKQLPRDARPDEVERKFLLSAIQFYETIAQRNTANPDVQAVLARAHRRAGDIYTKLGDRARALASYDRAILLLDGVLAEAPADAFARLELAAACNDLGLAHRDAGESADSVAEHKARADVRRDTAPKKVVSLGENSVRGVTFRAGPWVSWGRTDRGFPAQLR